MFSSNKYKIAGRRWLMLLLLAILLPINALAVSVEKHRVVAYVTSWTNEQPDPRLMTNINYAFGHVNDTFDGVRIDNPDRLRRIAELKQLNPELQVQLSIGGWGSGRFSEMAADKKFRQAFAEDCHRVVDEYNLDGIDIDWEYPTSNAAGISSSPDDTKNFTLLMRELRKALPEGSLLTLASVHNASFIDFKSILPYIDFVNIMSYDMGTPPHHHSPLHSSPVSGVNSAETALNYHLFAGIPADKITLGIPFYGRGKKPYSNFVDFKDITLKPGYEERWDSIACAPYIADAEGNLVLGYDNAESLKCKCEFIKDNGLLGAMYWDYAGDSDSCELRKAVANSMMNVGYPACEWYQWQNPSPSENQDVDILILSPHK